MRTGYSRKIANINQLTLFFMDGQTATSQHFCAKSQTTQLQNIRTKIKIFISEYFSHLLDGAHDISHLDRVWKIAQYLADFYDADLRIILATAYFHDLLDDKSGSIEADRKRKIFSMLKEEGYDDSEIYQIENDAMCHRYSKRLAANSLEGKILQDADRLDAIGCIGIARAFYFSGHARTKILHPDDPFAENRAVDDKQYAIDHFEAKLLKLPAQMNTKKAAEIAQTRIKLMKSFLKSLRAEITEPTDS